MVDLSVEERKKIGNLLFFHSLCNMIIRYNNHLFRVPCCGKWNQLKGLALSATEP